jgi:integrase
MARNDCNRQIYSLTPPGFRWPQFVDFEGNLVTRTAGNLPLICWPDGSWCGPANTYMRELLEKGLSRKNRGGSLSVAAAHLTHLIRYCWHTRTDFIDLTDNQFYDFVHALIAEKDTRDPSRARRQTNTTIEIGKTCLAFLDSVGRQCGDLSFLGSEGRIRAYIREYRISIRRGGRGKTVKTVRGWHHPAIPHPAATKRRMPIGSDSIEKLRDAVKKISTNSHQRKRRHVLLKLLEITGARRAEIASITTKDVEDALAMELPMLRIPTLKKRTEEYRYVPIRIPDLKFIKEYIDVERNSVILRKLKSKPDHGIILLNDRTGDALRPNTLTQEIRCLAKSAGIVLKACPHMFRHRFITKVFVALIEQHELENKDDLRHLLIDGESIKTKVTEWTGHADFNSLDRYINLAFEEVERFKKTYDVVQTTMAIDSFIGTLEADIAAVEANEQGSLERARQHLIEFRRDLAKPNQSDKRSTDKTDI